MTQRVVIHFQHEEVADSVEARLYIRDGVVLNPHVEERVKAEGMSIVGIRRTGQGYRNLLPVFVEAENGEAPVK